MASSLTHPEAQLRKRNEKLERLWAMDEKIRTWHANGAWRSSENASQSAAYSDLMTDRHLLATELRQMGCAPWDFHPERDNSWLCVQRQRIA